MLSEELFAASSLMHVLRGGKPGDYLLGANIAGFIRVADALVACGNI